MPPIIFTASILMPAFVVPILTEEHTFPVEARASGMLSMKVFSYAVIPLWTRAEYPPRKSIPISFAALSSVRMSSICPPFAAEIRLAGVIDTLLFTIGIPYSVPMSLPILTRFLADSVILSYTLRHMVSIFSEMQSNSDMPSVIVLTSRC